MDFENLGDIWQAGARLYVRCAKPRRDGLKSVRSCGEQLELDVRTLLWTRGKAFPISMLVQPHALPEMRLARGDGAADAAGQRAGGRGEGKMRAHPYTNSIQDFIDDGTSVTIFCHGCNYRGDLDLMKLRDRLGPENYCV